MPAAPATATGASRSARTRDRARALNAARGDTDVEFGPPKASDMAETRRRAAAQNRAAKEDYQREQSSRSKPAAGGGATRPSSASRPRSVSPSSSTRPASTGNGYAEEGAGVVLGVIAYALFLSYIQYGWPGVRGWFAAKFLNKPYNPSTASGVTASTPAPQGPQLTSSTPSSPSAMTYPQPTTLPTAETSS